MDRLRTPPPVPPPAPPAPLDDDSRTATAGELRSLRRWLVVAAVWASAATAIAAIAWWDQQNDESAGQEAAGDAAGRLSALQRSVDERLARVESRIEGLARTEDVRKLEDRVRELEDGASRESRSSAMLSRRLDDLERRLGELGSGRGSGDQRPGGAPAPERR